MMGEGWRWLLDLERIPTGADTIRLGWERSPEPWVMLGVFFFVSLFALWSYSGLAGNRVGRGLTASARGLILLALVLLIAGPQLVVPQETVEADNVLFLIDRSQSLSVADAGQPSTNRVTRDARLRQILTDSAEVFAQIRAQHKTLWLGFDAGAYDLSVDDLGLPRLPDAIGASTAIGPAIEQALTRVSGRPVSAIVIFSDGRTPEPPDRALLRRLQAEAIPVYALPLGSADAVADLSFDAVEAPARAFLTDKVPVLVRLTRSGTGNEKTDWPPGDVVLVDSDSGEIIDSAPIDGGEGQPGSANQKTLTLTATPSAAGKVNWSVQIRPRAADLVETNNAAEVSIDLVDRSLKVLYIDGYPRWEYRYLKNLLVRETSIDSSVFLLSADRDFAQEGNLPITRLPASAQELDPYDVIILGDLPAAYFAPGQLELFAEHVARRGAGLLWIAGERDNPESFSGSALAPLIPLAGSLTLARLPEPVTMMPTPAAAELGVLQITRAGQDAWPLLSDPRPGWTALRWALRLEPQDLKPTAEVLAHSVPRRAAEQPHPIVVAMRYGAGQTLFVGTDEIWRWRFGQGELFPEQFYLQLIRMLGRDRLTVSGRPAVLTVDPAKADPNQPVIVDLRILDASLLDSAPSRIMAEILPADPQAAAVPPQEIELAASPDSPGRYSAAFISEQTGDFVVRTRDPLLDALDLSAAFSIHRPDDELLFPAADHELLAQIASQTRGAVLQPPDLAQLPAILPNRTLRTPTDIVESIWDSPLSLILLAGLLTLEWVGRKLLSLV